VGVQNRSSSSPNGRQKTTLGVLF